MPTQTITTTIRQMQAIKNWWSGSTPADEVEVDGTSIDVPDALKPFLSMKRILPECNEGDTDKMRDLFSKVPLSNFREVSMKFDGNWITILASANPHKHKSNINSILNTLNIAGVQDIVSLDSSYIEKMTEEINRYNSDGFPRPITIHKYEIEDFSLPKRTLLRDVYILAKRLASECKPMYMHCGEGYGRTGTMLAALYILSDNALDVDPLGLPSSTMVRLGAYESDLSNKFVYVYPEVAKAIAFVRQYDSTHASNATHYNSCHETRGCSVEMGNQVKWLVEVFDGRDAYLAGELPPLVFHRGLRRIMTIHYTSAPGMSYAGSGEDISQAMDDFEDAWKANPSLYLDEKEWFEPSTEIEWIKMKLRAHTVKDGAPHILLAEKIEKNEPYEYYPLYIVLNPDIDTEKGSEFESMVQAKHDEVKEFTSTLPEVENHDMDPNDGYDDEYDEYNATWIQKLTHNGARKLASVARVVRKSGDNLWGLVSPAYRYTSDVATKSGTWIHERMGDVIAASMPMEGGGQASAMRNIKRRIIESERLRGGRNLRARRAFNRRILRGGVKRKRDGSTDLSSAKRSKTPVPHKKQCKRPFPSKLLIRNRKDTSRKYDVCYCNAMDEYNQCTSVGEVVPRTEVLHARERQQIKPNSLYAIPVPEDPLEDPKIYVMEYQEERNSFVPCGERMTKTNNIVSYKPRDYEITSTINHDHVAKMKDVYSAGHLILDGSAINVDNNSGHYIPLSDGADYATCLLKKLGYNAVSNAYHMDLDSIVSRRSVIKNKTKWEKYGIADSQIREKYGNGFADEVARRYDEIGKPSPDVLSRMYRQGFEWDNGKKTFVSAA